MVDKPFLKWLKPAQSLINYAFRLWIFLGNLYRSNTPMFSLILCVFFFATLPILLLNP